MGHDIHEGTCVTLAARQVQGCRVRRVDAADLQARLREPISFNVRTLNLNQQWIMQRRAYRVSVRDMRTLRMRPQNGHTIAGLASISPV